MDSQTEVFISSIGEIFIQLGIYLAQNSNQSNFNGEDDNPDGLLFQEQYMKQFIMFEAF